MTVLLAFVWSVVRVGPNAVYNTSTGITIEPWPFPDLPEAEAYIRSSPIGPWLVGVLHIETSRPYLYLSIAAATLACCLLAGWAGSVVAPKDGRGRAMRIMVLAPVTAVMFSYLGNYDPYTVIGFAGALWAWRSGNRWLLLLAGVYMGVQHFEQAIVATIAWALTARALRGALPSALATAPSPLWSIPGIVVGKLTLMALLALAGVSSTAGRVSFLGTGDWVREAVVGSANFLPVLAASLFAGLWGVALLAARVAWSGRDRWLLPAAILMVALAAVLTLDHTRVFAVASVPMLATMVVASISWLATNRSSAAGFLMEGFAWLIPPMIVISGGGGPTYLAPMNALDELSMLGQHLLGL